MVEFFCPNGMCPDYGKRGKGNIVLKERYGKRNTALLKDLNLSQVQIDEIRAQSSRFLPVTTGTHTKTHWSMSTALKSSQNTKNRNCG